MAPGDENSSHDISPINAWMAPLEIYSSNATVAFQYLKLETCRRTITAAEVARSQLTPLGPPMAHGGQSWPTRARPAAIVVPGACPSRGVSIIRAGETWHVDTGRPHCSVETKKAARRFR